MSKADGITRRKRGDGSTAYQARPSVKGKRLSSQTFNTLKEARDWKQDRERLHRRKPGSTETADSFAARWTTDYPVVKSGPTRGRLKNPRTLKVYNEALKPFVREFRGVKLMDLDRTTARQFAVRYPKSAVVVRSMLNDALDDELVPTNPFAGLRLEQSKGRSEHRVISPEELHQLADQALKVHGPEYGPVFRSLILFSAYVGPRQESVFNLDWHDIDLHNKEVHFRVVKFDKPYTAVLLPEAIEALRSMPRRTTQRVFYAKRGGDLNKTNHYPLWNPVRAAAGLSETAWHARRHFAAFHFYVTLGFTDELAGAQLGHANGEQIRRVYGHGSQDAVERLHQGIERPTVVPMDRDVKEAGA